jgi:SAM-dependent methyltransferase
MNLQLRSLHNTATRPFLDSGRHAWHSVRGKLRFDPVFFALLMRGILPDRGELLDLGCGRGILLALLVAARDQYLSGKWPEGWPPPPLHLTLRGLELQPDRVKTARQALGGRVQIDHIDIRCAEFAPCTAIVILDVLLYLNAEDQFRLLEKAAAALDSDGVLLVREADAGAGFAFTVTQCTERLVGIGSGRGWQPLHYRSATEWLRLLESLGLTITVESMSAGTPFANVLFIARRSKDSQAILHAAS